MNDIVPGHNSRAVITAFFLHEPGGLLIQLNVFDRAHTCADGSFGTFNSGAVSACQQADPVCFLTDDTHLFFTKLRSVGDRTLGAHSSGCKHFQNIRPCVNCFSGGLSRLFRCVTLIIHLPAMASGDADAPAAGNQPRTLQQPFIHQISHLDVTVICRPHIAERGDSILQAFFQLNRNAHPLFHFSGCASQRPFSQVDVAVNQPRKQGLSSPVKLPITFQGMF